MNKKIFTSIFTFFIILNICFGCLAVDEIENLEESATESSEETTDEIQANQNENMEENNGDGMQWHSEAVVLIDNGSGEVLYEKDMKKRLYPASLTKVLTVILAIENCNLNDEVTASEYAVNSITDGYTTAGIKIGETFTLEQILEVTMLKSANEAATMLAEHVSGSVEEFSKLMNEKAKEIGCLDSNFVNANGMHNENHYSTAYDMALIQRYCMKNKEFRRISALTSCSLPNTSLYDKEPRVFKNTNGLLVPENKDYYKYAIAGKTGFTTPAKNCLITCAKKDDLEVTAVVLHAEGKVENISARYFDTIQLFNYGFDVYEKTVAFEKDSFVQNISIKLDNGKNQDLGLVLADDISVLNKKGESISKSKGEVELAELKLPISKGDVLGKVKYEIDGKEYYQDVVAEHNLDNIKNANIKEVTVIEEEKSFVAVFIILALILVLIFVVILFLLVIKKEKKHVKEKEFIT